jgi:hypothetical protein
VFKFPQDFAQMLKFIRALQKPVWNYRKSQKSKGLVVSDTARNYSILEALIQAKKGKKSTLFGSKNTTLAVNITY